MHTTTPFARSRCSSAASSADLRAEICREIPAAPEAPEWVELVPKGRDILGRDGRRFVNDKPRAILEAFERNAAKLPIDWEHATEIKGPKGEEAPAAGWIVGLEERDGGSIWARVEWTARGAESVKSRSYRYISPVFLRETKTSRIVAVLSAGLTNQPNLKISELNRGRSPAKESHLDPKELAKLLGLPETATEEEIKAAISANRTKLASLEADLATARNAADRPSLERFVPRADYEAAVGKVAKLEAEANAAKAAKVDAEIASEIESALKAGKITPATADYHRESCKAEGGLERFRKFVAAAPVIGADSNLGGTPPATSPSTLTAEQVEICRRLNITAEAFLAAGKQ